MHGHVAAVWLAGLRPLTMSIDRAPPRPYIKALKRTLPRGKTWSKGKNMVKRYINKQGERKIQGGPDLKLPLIHIRRCRRT